MIPVVRSRSKSLGSLVFFPGFSNWSSSVTTEESREVERTEKGVTNQLPLVFQFYACEMVLEEEGVYGGERRRV